MAGWNARQTNLRAALLTLILCLSTLTTLTAPAASAQGATIVVTSAEDELLSDGDCTLREAITAANSDSPVDGCRAGSGPDTILLPPGLYRIEMLGAGEDEGVRGDFDPRGDLTIRGAGVGRTTIDAAQVDRIFDVGAGATLRLSGLTLARGAPQVTLADGEQALEHGGALRSAGTLQLADLEIIESVASSGGALASYGDLTVARSLLARNEAASAVGGAIYSDGALTVSDSMLLSNKAASGGGAIYALGTASVERSTAAGNNIGVASGPLDAGAILSFGELRLNNSTVIGNTAFGAGVGGVVTFGPARISDSTIARNSSAQPALAAGLYTLGPALLRGSILAGNMAGSAPADCAGDLMAFGASLIQTPCLLGGETAGVLFGVDPLLGGLEDNGGRTWTVALRRGSPAIDVGGEGCSSADQRGVARTQGQGCDLGAFEFVDNTLDRFSRRDASLLPDWAGPGRDGYQVRGGVLNVAAGGPLYWVRRPMGPHQEASLLLRTVGRQPSAMHGLLLKVRRVRGVPDWREGAIRVAYDGSRGELRVETYQQRPGWQTLERLTVSLEDGDVLGARAAPDGTVRVYRNSQMLLSVDTTRTNGSFFVDTGGSIGLWFADAAGAVADDFAGGDLP